MLAMLINNQKRKMKMDETDISQDVDDIPTEEQSDAVTPPEGGETTDDFTEDNQHETDAEFYDVSFDEVREPNARYFRRMNSFEAYFQNRNVRFTVGDTEYECEAGNFVGIDENGEVFIFSSEDIETKFREVR